MKRKRGGRRPGAGRKAKDGMTGLKRYTVSLDSDNVLYLTQLGEGSLSAGIRTASRIAKGETA